MFIQRLHKNTAQATTEIALFGTIMIVIFATLLRYGVIYNAKQETQMYAFRQALNLTKQRFDGNLIGNRQFASTSLNVMRNIFPPPIYVGSVQESSIADGSANVLAETEANRFGDADGPQDLDDIGGNYYQISDRMFVDKEYIEPAFVKVKRKINKGKMATHPWDGIMDFFDGAGDKEDYETWQPIPYREQDQYANVTHNSQYVTSEDSSTAFSGQLGTTHTVTQTVFKPPAYYINGPGGLEEKMKDWDPDIINVQNVVGYSQPQDMKVTTDKTLEKLRIWNSQKQ